MKQLLQQYAAYNVWANKRIIDAANHLSDEQVNKEIVSSFPSIFKTVTHLMEVENVWFERAKLVEQPTQPGWFKGNFKELTEKWSEISAQWLNWVQQLDDAKLTHVFAYYNFKKEYFKQPVYEMLMHLFNHQTYHRGQLVTMFRQLGVGKFLIPILSFLQEQSDNNVWPSRSHISLRIFQFFWGRNFFKLHRRTGTVRRCAGFGLPANGFRLSVCRLTLQLTNHTPTSPTSLPM